MICDRSSFPGHFPDLIPGNMRFISIIHSLSADENCKGEIELFQYRKGDVVDTTISIIESDRYRPVRNRLVL